MCFLNYLVQSVVSLQRQKNYIIFSRTKNSRKLFKKCVSEVWKIQGTFRIVLCKKEKLRGKICEFFSVSVLWWMKRRKKSSHEFLRLQASSCDVWIRLRMGMKLSRFFLPYLMMEFKISLNLSRWKCLMVFKVFPHFKLGIFHVLNDINSSNRKIVENWKMFNSSQSKFFPHSAFIEHHENMKEKN